MSERKLTARQRAMLHRLDRAGDFALSVEPMSQTESNDIDTLVSRDLAELTCVGAIITDEGRQVLEFGS